MDSSLSTGIRFALRSGVVGLAMQVGWGAGSAQAQQQPVTLPSAVGQMAVVPQQAGVIDIQAEIGRAHV